MSLEARGRVVFDEAPYYGGDGEAVAIEDLMSRYGMGEDEVREDYSDEQLSEHAMDMMREDFELELSGLRGFFDGGSRANPNAGNHVLVRGSSTTYFGGTRHGISVYDDLDSALDTSPSLRNYSNVFADCEIGRIWDENGRLFVSGAHHDGGVTVEVRQVSNEAERLVFDKLDYEGDIIDINPVEAMGRTYREGDENELFHDLWDDPALCAPPRYMERAFGWPREELVMGRAGGGTLAFVIEELDGGHPARREGYTLDARVLVDGVYAGNGRLCRSLAEAERFCGDWAASVRQADAERGRGRAR